MRVMLVGDVIGRPGRVLVRELLPSLRENLMLDVVIANGENLAGGIGATPKVVKELLASGVDIVTMGNHVWKKKEMVQGIGDLDRVIRPANFPHGAPGRGSGIFELSNGLKLGVVNLLGRVFMFPLDCPFRAVTRELEQLRSVTSLIIVDMHAEATSEKQAMGWYLDGRVSAVIGTHTHVVTADERILPKGTAYISDVGMTGSQDSILGMKKEQALSRFLTAVPAQFEVASNNNVLQAAVVEIDDKTGQALKIFRVSEEKRDRENANSVQGE